MYFEPVRSERGCVSYLIGCEKTCAAIVVDPLGDQMDRYLALTASRGMRIRYLLDTHTHADHFSAVRELRDRLHAPSIMHRSSPAPFVDLHAEDGETIIVGELRLNLLHTPGHTRDSMCVVLPDRVLTGDTLLLGGAGRTDLPTGDPEALYESLFERLLRLDGTLLVYPAHNYKNLAPTSLDEQKKTNPRLQMTERSEFVEMMRNLSIAMPDHLTEALRTNQTGGRTVSQIIQEAAERISFMTMDELRRRIESGEPGVHILDVREAEAYAAGHPEPSTCRAASSSCASTRCSPTRRFASSPTASSGRSRRSRPVPFTTWDSWEPSPSTGASAPGRRRATRSRPLPLPPAEQEDPT